MLKIEALGRVCERDRPFSHRVDGGKDENEESDLSRKYYVPMFEKALTSSPHHADMRLGIVGNEEAQTSTVEKHALPLLSRLDTWTANCESYGC